MKINEVHISSIIKQKEFLDKFIELQIANIKNHPMYEGSLDEASAYVSRTFTELWNTNQKPFLMKRSAMQVVDKIKIDGSFHPSIFERFKNNMKGVVITDEHTAYLYWRDDFMLRGMRVTYNPKTTMLSYDSFGILISSGAYTANYEQCKEVFDTFIRLLIFIHFSELETSLLLPKTKYGTKTSQDRWLNETNTTFIIVDSTWNKTIIRAEGFSVRGHFRLQPYGIGLTNRKLIFVKEFEKSGYVRKAKKTNFNQ